MHYTTSCNAKSSAPEDGRDHRPKHAELIGIINKPLFLHLFVFMLFTLSCLHYLTVNMTFKKVTRNIRPDTTTLRLDNWLQRQEDAATSNVDFEHHYQQFNNKKLLN